MNWYKNLFAYKLNDRIDESKLKNLVKIKECGKHDLQSIGWSSILNDGFLYYKTSDSFMLQLQIDKKSIPASMIKKETAKRIQKLKDEGESKIDKKYVKETVTQELAKNAYPKSSYIQGYIDNKNKLLVINATTASQIDTFVGELRSALDDKLDIDMIVPDFDMGDLLTKWVTEKEADEPFELEDTCALTDINSGSVTIYKKQDLCSDEIEKNLASGKRVNELKLNWHERFSFTVSNDFKIKGIKVSSSVGEQVASDVGEDDSDHTLFLASMMVMVEDFAEFLQDLISKGN